MDSRKKSAAVGIQYPAIYYFPGAPLSTKAFGHIAIAFGPDESQYMTYGRVDASKTLARDLSEYTKNGKYPPVIIPLPAKKLPAEFVTMRAKWRNNWEDKNYRIPSHNCAHSVVYWLHQLGYINQKQYDFYREKNPLRPFTIAKLAISIAQHSVTKEHQNITESAVTSQDSCDLIMRLLENNVARLRVKELDKKSDHITHGVKAKKEKIEILESLENELSAGKIATFVQHFSAVFPKLGKKTQESLAPCKELIKTLGTKILEPKPLADVDSPSSSAASSPTSTNSILSPRSR